MGAGYEISVNDVSTIVETLERLLSDFTGAGADLGRLTLPAASFGQVGSAAANAGQNAHHQLTVALQALAKVLQELNRRIGTSARDYHDRDALVARELTTLARGR